MLKKKIFTTKIRLEKNKTGFLIFETVKNGIWQILKWNLHIFETEKQRLYTGDRNSEVPLYCDDFSHLNHFIN